MKFAATLTTLFVCLFVATAQSGKPAYPVDSSYTALGQYKKYVKHYPYLSIAEDTELKGVQAKRNLVYTTLENTPYGKRNLHLDIFYPKKDGKYPVLLLVHGGGWRAGNKSLQIPLAQKIAQRGFVTITVEYQLALEAPYPAAVHNIKSAVRWVRANAQNFPIDTSKIAISGCSAGGHLAALVGLTNGVDIFEGTMGNPGHSSDIQAIIDIDGVLNFMAPTSLNKKRSNTSPDVQWLGGQFTEVPQTWKEASPIYWANKNSVPILFLNSSYPRFHAGQDELIGMYKEWGLYYEVHKFNVRMHTFWLFHPFADQTVEYMVDFMNIVF